MWYEIAEADRRCRDHGEVERVEVAPALRTLEVVYEKCPKYPARYEYKCYSDEFAVVDM